VDGVICRRHLISLHNDLLKERNRRYCKIEVHVCLETMMPENTNVENPVTAGPDLVVALTARIVAAYVVKHRFRLPRSRI
jgi:tRNA uridine 5-carbamoylmethylation protein Kti12